MKAYLKHIFEMAVPRETDISKTYYHGSSKIKSAYSIMRSGIKPPDLSLVKKNKLTPRSGKIYITPSIEYAQIYAIGANAAGTDYYTNEEIKRRAEGSYEFLFVIDGKDISDIEPDEDGVGELLYELLNRKESLSIKENNLVDVARTYLTPNQFRLLKAYNDYADLAAAGKKLMNYFSTEQKFWFIDNGAHIAHHGIIKPKEAWKIDLHRVIDLKKDGSNFFQVAERIK